MKKWTLISVLAAILIFVVLLKTGAAYSEDKIVYGKTLTGENYSCQKARFFDRDFVFIWNNDDQEADYYRIDGTYSQILERVEENAFAEVLVLLRSEDTEIEEVQGGNIRLYEPAGAVLDTIDDFTERNIFLFLLIFYPVTALLVILLLNGIFEKHSVVTKLYCIAQLLLIIFVIGTVYITITEFIRQYDDETVKSLNAVAENIKDSDGRYEEAVSYSCIGLYDCLNLNVNKDGVTVADSLRLPISPKLEDYYGTEAYDMVKQAYSERTGVSGILRLKNGRCNALAYYSALKGNGAQVLLLITPFEALQQEINEYVKQLIWYIGMIFGLCTVILILAMLVYRRRWNKLDDAIDRVIVNKEEYTVPQKHIDGFIPLWKGISQACRSLGSVRYDVNQGLKTSMRFVPKKLISLFERKDLTDVTIGDFKTVNGCMVQLSMDNMKSLDGGDYMNFLNTVNGILTKNQDRNDAIRINCDPDLKKNKFFFKAGVESAISFATDVAHELKEDSVTKVSKRLFMINKSDYNCGMSGADDQIVPFVYSKDDEILENYEEQLRNAGVEVVLTENVLECIGNTKGVRYIGYISSPVNNRSIKLYENLDVYSEFKHKIIRNTEKSFQKGLELFYSDDFYLARNTFNEVIQVNPNDQIARWYLFTCEHYLNMEGNFKVSYSLFDSRVEE